MKLTEKQKQYRRDIYFYYKNKHICTRCHSEKVEKGNTVCISCRMKLRKYYKKNFEILRKKWINNEYRNKRKTTYHNRVNAGICPQCGKRKLLENHSRCSVCTSWNNYKRRENYRLKTYENNNLNKIRV